MAGLGRIWRTSDSLPSCVNSFSELNTLKPMVSVTSTITMCKLLVPISIAAIRSPCGVLGGVRGRGVLPPTIRTLALGRGSETVPDTLFIEEPPVLVVCELFIAQIMLAAERNVHGVKMATRGRAWQYFRVMQPWGETSHSRWLCRWWRAPHKYPAALGACPSNGRDCDGSEMSRMRGGGSSRLWIMSLRDPTTKQTGHFRPTPRGGVLFGPPLRRGSSEYHPCQVRHRRRCLTGAKNHAVATRRLLGQAPSPTPGDTPKSKHNIDPRPDAGTTLRRMRWAPVQHIIKMKNAPKFSLV